MLAGDDERIARLLDDIAADEPDIGAMLARDQDQMDRVLAELGRQDREQVAMIDAMIAAEQAETDRFLADIARADPAAEIAAMLAAERKQTDRLLGRIAAESAEVDRTIAELIDRDQTPATWTKGRRK